LQRNITKNREKYEEARKETSELCRKEKKQWLNNMIKHIEHHMKKDNREILKMLKKFEKNLYQEKSIVKMKWEIISQRKIKYCNYGKMILKLY
jgi:uncharacterized protein YPO0396